MNRALAVAFKAPMPKYSLILIIASAVIGAAVANVSRVSAESEPAWDRDLTRQLVRAQEGQEKALQAIARGQEQQTRALQELVRATERAADKCSH